MKKKLLIIFGYLAFFLFSFLFSLYLTFDPRPIKNLAQNYLKNKGYQIEIGQISKYRLSGVRAQKIILAKENSSGKLQIDQLKARLSIIPLLAGNSRIKFQALLYGGKIEGRVEKSRKKINSTLKIKNIDLAKLSSVSSGGFQIKSRLSGQSKLNLANLNNPRAWEGEIDFQLGAGEISTFEYQGMEIPGIKISQGRLALEIKQGRAEIKTLELLSPDFPFQLQGEIELRVPLEKSLITLKGKLSPQEQYLEKFPLLTSLLSPDKTFSYKGTISGILNF